MSKLTAKELIRLEFEEGHDEVQFECNSCGETISSWELSTPCHTHDGFIEGSGHGGVEGMHIYCAFDEPPVDGASYCGWGGRVQEYFPLIVCKLCGKSPFEEEV